MADVLVVPTSLNKHQQVIADEILIMFKDIVERKSLVIALALVFDSFKDFDGKEIRHAFSKLNGMQDEIELLKYVFNKIELDEV